MIQHNGKIWSKEEIKLTNATLDYLIAMQEKEGERDGEKWESWMPLITTIAWITFGANEAQYNK